MPKWIFSEEGYHESYINQEGGLNKLQTIKVFRTYRSNDKKPLKICLALQFMCERDEQKRRTLIQNDEDMYTNLNNGLYYRLHYKNEKLIGTGLRSGIELTFKKEDLDLFDATLNFINFKCESIDEETLQALKTKARSIFGLSYTQVDNAYNEIKDKTAILAAQTILISAGNKNAPKAYQETLDKLINRINELEKTRFDEYFLYEIAANIMIEEYQQPQSAVDILEAFEKINKLTPVQYARLSELSLQLLIKNSSLSNQDKKDKLITILNYSLKGLNKRNIEGDNSHVQQAENTILQIIQYTLENNEASKSVMESLLPYLEFFKSKLNNKDPYNIRVYKDFAEKNLQYMPPLMVANLIFDIIQSKKEIFTLQNRNAKTSIADSNITFFSNKENMTNISNFDEHTSKYNNTI